MTIHARSKAENELITLRKGITDRYLTYHHRDRLRFPMLECNTNRTNYLPLRESFEEEFFVLRGIDRQQQTIHIPSTTTLSLLFTDDNYVPGSKILNTCWSYAEGSVQGSFFSQSTEQHRPKIRPDRGYRWLLPGGVGFLAGLIIGLGVGWYRSEVATNWSVPVRDNQTLTISKAMTASSPVSKPIITTLINR